MLRASHPNRIAALLVALLYLFFSTFGAVAHTHASADGGRSAAASIGVHTTHVTPAAHYLVPAQPDCAACEWQALSVTQTSGSHAQIESALLSIVPTVRAFSLYTVCLARFSSRAPPAV